MVTEYRYTIVWHQTQPGSDTHSIMYAKVLGDSSGASMMIFHVQSRIVCIMLKGRTLADSDIIEKCVCKYLGQHLQVPISY